MGSLFPRVVTNTSCSQCMAMDGTEKESHSGAAMKVKRMFGNFVSLSSGSRRNQTSVHCGTWPPGAA
eukprot:scaffold185006_cov26-Tisochrysis_lutea.AAC.1